MLSLNAFLSKEHRDKGLTLTEEDDHFVILKHGEKVIAKFYTTNILTIKAVHDKADEYLAGIVIEVKQ